MNDFDEMPTMNAIHLLALKDNQIFDLKKTLRFYADKENYKRSEDDHQTGYPHEIMWDKGSKARQALKGSQ